MSSKVLDHTTTIILVIATAYIFPYRPVIDTMSIMGLKYYLGFGNVYHNIINPPIKGRAPFVMSDLDREILLNRVPDYDITQYPVKDGRVFYFNGSYVWIDDIAFNKRFPESDEGDLETLRTLFREDGVGICPYEFCLRYDTITNLANDREHCKFECETGHYDRFMAKYSMYTPEEYNLIPPDAKEDERKFIREAYKNRGRGHTTIKYDDVILKYGHKIDEDLVVKPFMGGYKNKYF